jgi:predicted PurR-regulated permease PerM
VIRVVLPYHLRALARVTGEIELDLAAPVTRGSVLDALEARYPMLCGTIRDQTTRERRPFLRFFACERDLSHQPAEAPLPDAVTSGAEPLLVIGAIAGGLPVESQQVAPVEPLLHATRRPRGPVALTIIAIILTVAALYWGHAFFIPVVLALTFHAVFRPVVRKLERLRVPTVLGAALVVLGALGAAVASGWALSDPVSEWVNKAPENLKTARAKLRRIGRPLDRLSEAATGTPATAPAPAPPSLAAPATNPLFAQLIGKATSLITVIVEVILLLYLMLAGGTLFLRKMVNMLPRSTDKQTRSDILHKTESIVAVYLTLTAVINAGQGVLVGLALWAIGMPDPLIWGLLTFALEFIPYLGGVTMVGLLLIGGFTTFPDVGQALLAPAIYLVITTIVNTVVVAYIFGDRLKLSPLSVVLCVLFWWFIWGIPGAFLAIPIAATLKALGDQIPRLAPLGEFLGE